MNVELHRAARNKKIKEVQRLLDQGADVNARDDRGWTPLSHAAYYGYLKIVELLVSKGADVKAHEPEFGTVLHKVTKSGYQENKKFLKIAELLIEKGADVNAKIKKDEDEYEDENGEPVVLDEKSGYTRPLHHAAGRAKIKIAKLLISKGADVTVKDEYGQTALHRATGNQDEEMINLLVSNGADVNAKNERGCTPLHAAIEANRKYAAKVLKKLGGVE